MTNIIVRRTEPTDASALKQIFEGEQCYSQTLQLPHPSLKLWTDRVADIPDHIHSFVAQTDDDVIGNISIAMQLRARRRHVATLGIAVKEEWIGHGVGPLLLERAVDLCDNWLGIHRIELTVFSDNERAIALYQKFNFVIEGEAIDYAMRNGRFENVLHMARLANPR